MLQLVTVGLCCSGQHCVAIIHTRCQEGMDQCLCCLNCRLSVGSWRPGTLHRQQTRTSEGSGLTRWSYRASEHGRWRQRCPLQAVRTFTCHPAWQHCSIIQPTAVHSCLHSVSADCRHPVTDVHDAALELADSIWFVVARTVHIQLCVVVVCMKGPPYTERNAGPAQSRPWCSTRVGGQHPICRCKDSPHTTVCRRRVHERSAIYRKRCRPSTEPRDTEQIL